MSAESENLSLRPSKVRDRILQEHQSLREMIAEMELSIAKKDIASLSQEMFDFQNAFLRHLETEEESLWPVIETMDSWGPVRLQRIANEHRTQRRHLNDLRSVPSRNYLMAVKAFLDEIKIDMEVEENDYINYQMLNDFVATDSQFGG